ncbi:hypothetical protein AALK14_00860 [Butyricimonas hominis]|uniref:hypothetical protein n=1 Tax=Butyricimonas TaxID=574697 RepID=UPI003511CFA9
MKLMNSKRILLTVPNFYSYPEIIENALFDLGFTVTKIVYPKKSIYMPIFCKSKFNFLRKIYTLFKDDFDDYSLYCESQIESLKFEYLLTINIPLSRRFIEKMKSENCNLQTIYYLWDSLHQFNFIKYLSYYDRVYTFDYADAKEFNIVYLPNFWYIDKNFSCLDEKERYDLFFVGKFSIHRAEVIVSLLQNNPELQYYIRLYNKTLLTENAQYREWLKTKSEDFMRLLEGIVVNETIMLDDINKKLMSSDCVLDIESYEQNGYSQRVVLALAKGKKLLTTNQILLQQSGEGEQVRDINIVWQDLHQWIVNNNNDSALKIKLQECEIHQWLCQLLGLYHE